MNQQTLAPIFLSASIPDRLPYLENSDPLLIREAVLALVAVTVRKRELVFGGHPAISPLVEHAARTLGGLENVFIYQSRWFEDIIPEVAKKFKNLVWTERGSSREESLRIMREEMIGSRPFCAAVFIGGMEGILEECSIFKALHPGKPVFPVASTLGAAQELLEAGEGPQDREMREELKTNKRYRELFRTILEECR
jgi:hypothetical protein